MDIQWTLKPTEIYDKGVEFDIAVNDDVIGSLFYREGWFYVTQARETQYEEGDTEKGTNSFAEAMDIINVYADQYPFDPADADYD